MKTNKFVLVTIAAGSMLALAACAPSSDNGGSGDGDGGLIGVAMPTKSSERWIQDGNAVKEALEAEGYTVDLQYAEDDIPTQVSQIENMITKGAEALIIASIDGTTLTEVLQTAADSEIPVIAYDRLIKGSENVDYYATFNNELVGNQQAWTVLNGLGLTELDGTPIEGAPEGPFNIELFAGSLDDNSPCSAGRSRKPDSSTPRSSSTTRDSSCGSQRPTLVSRRVRFAGAPQPAGYGGG